MALRRAAPYLNFIWLGAIVLHLFYFRYRTSVNQLPDCVGAACVGGAEVTQAPLVQPSAEASPASSQQSIKATNSSFQNDPVHIVYASDDEGLPAVGASIRSCLKQASEPVVFHFVGNTPLSDEFSYVHYYNLTEVGKMYKLKEFTNPKKRGGGLNSNLANFVRFAIPSLLPNETKAMWVDHDTIFECDPVPMIRNALTKTEFAIAAVPVEGEPHGVKKVTKRRFSKGVKYTFNAGVYVVDLDRWRSQHLTEKIRKLAMQNRKKLLYNYGSQPPLVLTIKDKFEHLSPAWNVKVNKLNLGLLKEKACLLHWSGKRKPWNTFGDPDIHNDLWMPYATPSNATFQHNE